jgi:hypothetical protein
MRTFTESVVDHHALLCAQALAESWEIWRGNCDICGTVNAFGFCDRCVNCAIECVYENEREYGGTSEAVRDYLDIPYGSGRCVRLLDAVVSRTLEFQTCIWLHQAFLNGGTHGMVNIG